MGILEFIYNGEVSIEQDCLPGFLAVAETLRIRGLTGEVRYYLIIIKLVNFRQGPSFELVVFGRLQSLDLLTFLNQCKSIVKLLIIYCWLNFHLL